MDEPPGGKLSSTAVSVYGTRDPRAADDHQRHGQQGAEVAAQRPRADHRLSAATTYGHQHVRQTAGALAHGRRRTTKRQSHGPQGEGPVERQARRDVLGPDHADRRQPGHLHQDRLRQPAGRRVPQHLVDLPRLQHLHEGQGPARRPLHHQPHLRHLRRQPRHLRHLRPEHGLRRQAAGHGRVDRQPRRGRRVHVRPQHLPGQPGRRRLLRADGQGDQPERLGQGAADRRPARRTCTATAPSPTS